MSALAGGNLLGAVVAFFVVALAVTGAILAWESWSEWRRRRAVAQQIRQLSESDLGGQSELARDLLRRSDRPGPPWMEAIVTHLPQRRDLQNLLEQADIDWSVGSVLLGVLGLGMALGTLGLVAGGARVAFVLAALGAALPFLYLRRRRRLRVEAFEKGLPDAIDLLGRSIRAGHALTSGLEIAAEELSGPVAVEFRQVFEEQKFGLPIRDSLLALADRVPLVDVRILVTAILIQRESGGNLAEILDNISYTIRERFKIRREIRIHTAQGRLTGYLLAVLPIVMALIILTVSPEYMSVLFEEPAGRLALFGAGLLQVTGYLAIRRIIDIDI